MVFCSTIPSRPMLELGILLLVLIPSLWSYAKWSHVRLSIPNEHLYIKEIGTQKFVIALGYHIFPMRVYSEVNLITSR